MSDESPFEPREPRRITGRAPEPPDRRRPVRRQSRAREGDGQGSGRRLLVLIALAGLGLALLLVILFVPPIALIGGNGDDEADATLATAVRGGPGPPDRGQHAIAHAGRARAAARRQPALRPQRAPDTAGALRDHAAADPADAGPAQPGGLHLPGRGLGADHGGAADRRRRRRPGGTGSRAVQPGHPATAAVSGYGDRPPAGRGGDRRWRR